MRHFLFPTSILIAASLMVTLDFQGEILGKLLKGNANSRYLGVAALVLGASLVLCAKGLAYVMTRGFQQGGRSQAFSTFLGCLALPLIIGSHLAADNWLTKFCYTLLALSRSVS